MIFPRFSYILLRQVGRNSLKYGRMAYSYQKEGEPPTFTETEIKNYYKDFIAHDEDKDGKLNRVEINNLFRQRFGRKLNVTDLEKMLSAMGVPFTCNLVTFLHYMTHMNKRFGPAYCQEELISIFKKWDKDSDGLLSWFEFRLATFYLGFDPDHPDLWSIFKTKDMDCDDKIEFKEFADIINYGIRRTAQIVVEEAEKNVCKEE